MDRIKTSKPKRLKKRIFRSWITSTVSISLVLLMLGALILVLVNAGKLSDYVREQIGFTLVLNDNLKEEDINRLEKVLAASDYVKSIRYIDKETAAQELTRDLGEDFMGFLGYNPLFASMDVKLFASYTNSDSLIIIEKEFLEYPQVKEVYYQKDLLGVVNDNVKKISLFLLIISVLTGFIFISLINNTIRLSIYSERFTINTMQLVGAARSFILKPFLLRAMTLGIMGALIANFVLAASMYTFRKEMEGIIDPAGFWVLGPVLLIVILIGVLISFASTWFAVNKFLKMKFDELFY
jgi:cell division transport system permease protein